MDGSVVALCPRRSRFLHLKKRDTSDTLKHSHTYTHVPMSSINDLQVLTPLISEKLGPCTEWPLAVYHCSDNNIDCSIDLSFQILFGQPTCW